MAKSYFRFLVPAFAGAIIIACAQGATPAHADCAKGEAQCPSNLGGGCAPVGSVCCPNNKYSVIGAACSGEQQGDWGAIAAVGWNDGAGNAHVASGFSLHAKTLSKASEDALLNCQAESNQLCNIVADFNNGACGYIALGTGASSARWAVSATADGASKECTQNGDACKAPVGGCTNKP
jgi:hypothetical protein